MRLRLTDRGRGNVINRNAIERKYINSRTDGRTENPHGCFVSIYLYTHIHTYIYIFDGRGEGRGAYNATETRLGISLSGSWRSRDEREARG